jgi:16S rRNA (guanine966-N2)-methyltransferase
VRPSKPAKPARVGRNSVRIVGGAWRGRRVHFPDSQGLRPTPDRVRETLFNWLQHAIAGSRCLDLFAGSGALGLEALSRGAREVVFVEREELVASALRASLAHLGAPAGSTRVVQAPAGRFLAAPGAPFDIIFLDPPFGQGALGEYVTGIDIGHWIASDGWVYLESDRSAGAPVLPAGWQLVKSKSAGEVGYHLARTGAQIGQ